MYGRDSWSDIPGRLWWADLQPTFQDNSTSNMLCNETEWFFVLITKKPTSTFIQQMGLHP